MICIIIDDDMRDDIIGAVEVIRANTNKQVLAFTGDTSELEELRAFF